MQTQNQHLLQQMAERDDYNIKVSIITFPLIAMTVLFQWLLIGSDAVDLYSCLLLDFKCS